jgi:hypothetical protein
MMDTYCPFHLSPARVFATVSFARWEIPSCSQPLPRDHDPQKTKDLDEDEHNRRRGAVAWNEPDSMVAKDPLFLWLLSSGFDNGRYCPARFGRRKRTDPENALLSQTRSDRKKRV